MTINSTLRTAGPFAGNGVTTVFPFSFKVFARSDVVVATTNVTTGVETLLTLDSDFTVALNTDQNASPGGIITMVVPPALGTTLAATSNIPLLQKTDLTNQGGFYPRVISDALDKITIQIQQLATKVGLGVNIGAAATVATILNFIGVVGTAAGASLIGFIHAAVGAVKRSVQDKLRDTTSGKDFGAKGDGTTDDVAAIQAAITWRVANGGGTVLLPAGNYLISTGLTWTGNNLVLAGEGKGATTITASFAAGDIITVGDGTANPNNAVIQSLRITANVAKTSGAAIRFRNGHNLKACDIRLDSNLFKGIALDGGAQHFSYYVQDFEIGASSVGIEFGSDGTQVADVFVSTGIVSGATSGLLFRNASGVYASHIDMIGCADAGIAMIPANGQGITSSFFDTVLGDTAVNQGWKIIPTGTGKVADIGFVNCWGSTTQNAAGAGLYITGPANSVSNLHFTNFRAVNNAGPGILIAQGRFLTFANCVATANSQSSSATYPGFSIVGTLTDIQITGGVYGGMNTLPQNQSYGISFGGACDYIQVLGANTRGNLTGGLINASSGTHNVVANNV